MFCLLLSFFNSFMLSVRKKDVISENLYAQKKGRKHKNTHTQTHIPNETVAKVNKKKKKKQQQQ